MINAGLILSLALLAGRLAGLLRELLLAATFGLSAEADAAVLMLSIPDLFVNLLAAGGLSAALVPRMSTLEAGRAARLLRHATLAALAAFGVLGLLLACWPRLLFELLAPGLVLPFGGASATAMALGVAVPLTAAAGVAGAYLNAQGKFFVTGCGTLLFNAAVLLALLLAQGGGDALLLLACGIAAGAAVRWGAQLATMPAPAWRCDARGPVHDRALVHAFLTAAASSALLLLAPLIVRAMASTLGAGAIASFNYAQKLIELPVAILITSVSTVALTRLSALHGSGAAPAMQRALAADTRYAVLIGTAVAALGILFADAVVAVLFGRGQMAPADLARVALLTRIALLGVPFVALSSMAAAGINARQQSPRLVRPTVTALAALPLLAAPGLVLQSEAALMGAVVAFQACVAILLARTARLPLAGQDGVLDRSLLPVLGAVLGACALAALLDLAWAPAQQWLRLVLAAFGFGLALLPIRKLARTAAQRGNDAQTPV